MSDTQPATPSPAITELAGRLQEALGAGYLVERPLGAGGFAVVFLAQDLQLKRRLAIKVLSPDLITSKTVLERFRREAEAIARLSHPNIVPLYFIGQKDDMLYLAMECVEGGSLAERLQREGRLSIDAAQRVLTEVASALAHAHRRGVVHRDVKPQNVLLDGDSGRALVTDFGIARMADSESLTASGMVLGTPAYLAPEQITGEASDHRVDIYAFGVLAYETLAGQTPFQAALPSAVLLKRLAGPPQPITRARPEVPRMLEEVITTCLAIDPAGRFQTADELVRALTGHTPTSGGHTTTALRVRKNPHAALWISLALGAAALAMTLVVLKPWTTGRAAESVPPAVRPVDEGMALIPDGEYVIGADAGPSNAMHRPAHRVTLAAFGLDRYEVTVGDYQQYVDSMRVAAPWTGTPEVALPVTRVSYTDALNYCRWKHGSIGRLPTEAEWEAAVRGPAGRQFPWGTEPIRGRANTASAGRGAPVRVGTFPAGATPEDVHDLIGNVWEWTSSPATAYPGGVAFSGSPQDARIIRGGGFNTVESLANPWSRVAVPLSASRDLLIATGFRCAMTPRR